MLTIVTRDQFVSVGPYEIEHRPTGNRYQTYPYEDPLHLREPLIRGASDTDHFGRVYSPVELASAALAILREKLAQQAA